MTLGAGFALLDVWLMPGAGWLVQCLRAAWMMFLPLRIMYADPYTSIKSGFGLIVGTVVLVTCVWLLKRAKQGRQEHPS